VAGRLPVVSMCTFALAFVCLSVCLSVSMSLGGEGLSAYSAFADSNSSAVGDVMYTFRIPRPAVAVAGTASAAPPGPYATYREALCRHTDTNAHKHTHTHKHNAAPCNMERMERPWWRSFIIVLIVVVVVVSLSLSVYVVGCLGNSAGGAPAWVLVWIRLFPSTPRREHSPRFFPGAASIYL
jgi:hypothetical protein